MTADQFAQVITELGWTQALVAFYLMRNPRTVRRWKAGEHKIPKEVREAMLDRSRLLAFSTWLDALESKNQEATS